MSIYARRKPGFFSGKYRCGMQSHNAVRDNSLKMTYHKPLGESDNGAKFTPYAKMRGVR
jgi:hypothetical protein